MPTSTCTRTSPFFKVSLPILPPGINGSYQPVMSGEHQSIADTKAERQFKRDARLLLSQWSIFDDKLIHAIKQSKRKTPLAIDISFYFTMLWRRDVDGGVKAVLDAAFHYIGLNDVLVCDLHVTKALDKENPRIDIEICCLAQPE